MTNADYPKRLPHSKETIRKLNENISRNQIENETKENTLTYLELPHRNMEYDQLLSHYI
jgi:hypothetical protein